MAIKGLGGVQGVGVGEKSKWVGEEIQMELDLGNSNPPHRHEFF